MKTFYKNVQQKIKQDEENITLDIYTAIEDSRKMSICLNGVLNELKCFVLKNGFQDLTEEVEFFRFMKPNVMGKLLFYNKVYRIEISRPHHIGPVAENYFNAELKKVENFYMDVSCCEFYKYYRSGVHHNDKQYFCRGNFENGLGLHGFAFNSDPSFTTYYDYKISKIIEADLLYNYLIVRIEDSILRNTKIDETFDQVKWIGSKSALVELIYAIHASDSIGGVNFGIRKLVLLFQEMFHVDLGDVHHLFHRMKYRGGNKTIFLDKLKASLEMYMDRE